MTISVETNKATFSGNDATVVFASGFKIFDDDDIYVELVTDSTSVAVVQVKDTDYTVGTITEPASAVDITMITAPASGESLVLRRNQPQIQSTDYVENDNLPAQTIENDKDKIVMMVQDLQEQASRTLHLDGSQTLSTDLPRLSGNAGRVVSVDTAETGFEYNSLAEAVLDINSLTAAAIAPTDTIPFYDASATVNKKIAFQDLESTINHDSLTDFVANEHIDWTSTSSNFSTSGIITGTGVVDFGGATSLEIPSGTSVTTNATGELALDTDGNGSTITHGMLQTYDGTQNLYGVLVTNYPTSDNDTVVYDSATNSAKWMTPTLGGAGINAVVEDAAPFLGGHLTLNSYSIIFPSVTVTDVLDEDAMGSDSATKLATQQSIKAYVDSNPGSNITAASTDTLTNKTIDANGTGNSISNIDVADLANGTDGELITWDAAGAPAVVAAGTATHILTSNGAGAAPTFQTSGISAGLIFLESQTASTSSSIDFSTAIDSTYEKYILDFTDLVISTDSTYLFLRTSSDGGSTYDSGASDYAWACTGQRSNGSGFPGADPSDSEISISGSASLGSAAGEVSNGTITLYNPAGTQYTNIHYEMSGNHATSGYLTFISGAGQRRSSADVDAFRLLMSTGTINSGTFKLYGVAKS